MTDLEATKLCAEAMGYRTEIAVDMQTSNGNEHLLVWSDGAENRSWNPLKDGAQALALVERLRIHLSFHYDAEQWIAKDPYYGRLVHTSEAWDEDLNRAIVYCVARGREPQIGGKT